MLFELISYQTIGRSIGDMHDDVTLGYAYLWYPSHRQCIGFADLQVDFLLQNLAWVLVQIHFLAMSFDRKATHHSVLVVIAILCQLLGSTNATITDQIVSNMLSIMLDSWNFIALCNIVQVL